MPQEITALATTTSWNEDRTTTSTPRVSHVTFTLAMPTMNGTLSSQSIMIYPAATDDDSSSSSDTVEVDKNAHGDASFVFADTVTAKDFAGHTGEGSFVIRGQGTYTAATRSVQEEFVIVEGTGTGALKGLRGKGVAGSSTGDAAKPGEMKYVFSVN